MSYTAFFDAIDRLLPDDLRKKISLKPHEKMHIAERAKKCIVRRTDPEESEPPREPVGPFTESLPFPHPTSTFEDIKNHLGTLYEHMAKGFDH
ncbi:MAG: hypothetical protein WAN11_13745 [Syntrophobacteraceae bacterium]